MGPAIAEDLAAALAAGDQVGNALAAYHRSPTAEEMGNRFLLFGDPRIRAAPAASAPVTAHSGVSHQSAGRASVEIRSRDPNLAALDQLALYIRERSRNEGSVTSARVRDEIARYEQDIGEAKRESGVALRGAVLAHLKTIKVHTAHAWVGTARVTRASKMTRCQHCGMRIRAELYELPTGLTRTVLVCIRCGLVADRPESSRLGVTVTPSRVEIHDPPYSDAWSAALYAVPATEASDIVVDEWPAGDSGNPVLVHEIDMTRWPRGPLTVQFVMLAGLSLHTVAAPARSTRHP